jgi:tetratricopeptide (TPR) repeat protein
MSTPDIEETLSPQVPAVTRRKGRTWLWIAGGIVWLLITIAIGGYIGYRAAVQARLAYQDSQLALKTTEQFQLAVQDINAKRYDTAQQRLEYVIQNDPGFPGAVEKLSQVMLAINLAKTPTVVPTPTFTSTPDLRGVEEMLNQAKQQIAAKDWNGALGTLDALRKENQGYQTVLVDDLYFIALRNRGVDKILGQGDLEGGIYDLTLAGRFGPIDAEAAGYITWARMYMTGASYWEVNWAQAAYYFGQIAPALPNLRDGSGMTASERYRQAEMKYGDQIAASGDYCKALEEYNKALQMGPNPTLQPTANWADQECNKPKQAEPTKGPTQTQPAVTPTPTVGASAPTETPAPPTATQQPVPSETPTPAPPTQAATAEPTK